MPWIVISSSLFSGGDRDESEDFILGLLGVFVRRNAKYLKKHPHLPKLYDSGVVYALPEQMEGCKIPENKLGEFEKYVRKLGASEESIDAIVSILHGVEMFRDIEKVYAKGAVDCDNLTTIRCAELWNAGILAAPRITWRETSGGTTYHALVQHPDGTSEDPSRILGLGPEHERVEERRKNRERHDTYLAAAVQLCRAGEMTAQEASEKIEAMGLVGKGWPNP